MNNYLVSFVVENSEDSPEAIKDKIKNLSFSGVFTSITNLTVFSEASFDEMISSALSNDQQLALDFESDKTDENSN